MKRKNYLQLLTIMMVAMLCVGFASCSKDDSNDELEQTENVSSQDPEGTIVLNMSSGASGNYYQIGNLCEIHIDEANNFRGGRNSGAKFVTVGLVSGLGKITQIPTSGWAESAAVVPGTGYVMRCGDQYARIYVVEYLGMSYSDENGNTYGQTTGATIKYQVPFILPIEIANTSLTFTSDAGRQSLQFRNPTNAIVEEKPEWCEVERNETGITISVSENMIGTQRTGEIVLKNTANSVKISVTQQGSSSPKFQTGSGTEQDPFQITNEQQLKNINKAPNAYFVLTADITLNEDAAGNGWIPIGNFTGTLDGKGHIIKNLWIKRPTTDYIGLFSIINKATISNLTIYIDEKGITGKTYVGAICGSALSSNIYDCIIIGDINGKGSKIGGICGSAGAEYHNGENYSSWFFNCSFKGNIIGNSEVGGICGNNYKGGVLTSKTEGTIGSQDGSGNYISGIVGLSEGVGRLILNCYSLASLNGKYCGGISWGGTHTCCYYAGKVSTNSYFSCEGDYTYYNKNIIGNVNYYNTSSTYNARSTSEMRKQSTYEGWDFTTIWQITEGKTYPILRCFDKDQQEESQQDSGGSNIPFGNDGTLATPFTPAEANAFIATLAADTNTDKDYYIKGKLVKYASNGEFGTQYGNASFYLSADGTESGEQFYVFRTLYLGNMKYSDDSWTKPKTGDEIIICGKLVNYKGNTPETVANKSYIYSLNGKTGTEGSTQSATRINTVRY